METIGKGHISARIQVELFDYLEDYQQRHNLPTRTAALEEAIRALQEREREREVREQHRQKILSSINRS
jgi:flagellar motility protein MotE (MotC chaperone)